MNSVVTAYPDALPEATSTSLSLPESLTFEQWEEIGAELANRARKLNWWIGDWWAAGHHRYGERARLAARGLFGKEFKTLANIASVCRAFEPSRRREHLSWSHHAEAAALSPNAADMLLDLAERDRLSKSQVRAAVTTIRGGPSVQTTPDEAAVAGLFRAYNRLPGEVRILVAQAFAAVAASGAEIDPATGNSRAGDPPGETAPSLDEAEAEIALDRVPDEAPLALAADIEHAPAEVESALERAELDVIPAKAEPENPFELAPDMVELPIAAEGYLEYDLTLDMVALQTEAEPAAPLELAREMEVVPVQAEAETALDLDLDRATSSEAGPVSAFDLETSIEEPQAGPEPDSALDLGSELEAAEEADKKAPSASEPWLLP